MLSLLQIVIKENNEHLNQITILVRFSENLMAIEMRKTRVFMNKPVYIGQTVLDISKTLMYEYYYDYLTPKYADKVKLSYVDTYSFIIYFETEDSGNSKDDKRLPVGINKKVIGKMKGELNGLAMTEFVALASNVYAYVCDNDKVDKRVKGIKRCVRDKVLKFQQYMDALLLNKTITATQQRFKSDQHRITTEKINKITLSRKDDKRIQGFDIIHPYLIEIDNDLLNELETERRNKPIELYD